MKKLYILTISIIVSIAIVSCNSTKNYYVVKEYFSQSKNSISKFTLPHAFDKNVDTIEVCEQVEMSKDGFSYCMNGSDDKFSMRVTPQNILITLDVSLNNNIITNNGYSVMTKDVFSKPNKFSAVNGIYREYKNKDIHGRDSLSLEINKNYSYKFYCSVSNGDLVIHRDYFIEIEIKSEYYFSKQKGLYKIIVETMGMTGEFRRIN